MRFATNYSTKLYNHYYMEYSEQSFAQIVQNYKNIEKELIKDINTAFFCHLEKFRASLIKRGLFKLNGLIYKYLISQTNYSRTLKIEFTLIGSKINYKRLESEVSSVGLINNITIDYPDKEELFFTDLIELLHSLVDNASCALKGNFVNKSWEFHNQSLDLLYEQLNQNLIREGKEYLIDKAWFVVFEKLSGVYSFSGDLIEKALDHYKGYDKSEYSAMQLVIWMMSQKLPFDKSLSKETFNEDRTLSTSFRKAKYIDDAYFFWLSNFKLFDSEDYSVTPIASLRTYKLTLAYPTKYKNDLSKVLAEINNDLEKQFKNNINKCHFWIRNVNNIKDGLTNLKNIDLEDLGAFSGAFTGSIYKVLSS